MIYARNKRTKEHRLDEGMLSRADFCRALYRAGYRKTGDE